MIAGRCVAVSRRERELVVKLRVLLDGELPALGLLALAAQDVLEVGDLLGRGALRGAGREGRLDHLADVEQLLDELALAAEHARDGHHHGLGRHVGDDGALALARHDEADELERADGVADRAAGDAEPLRELALRRHRGPALHG